MMPPIISDSVTAVNSDLRIAQNQEIGPNRAVKTCDELRLENLKRLIDEAGGEEALADRYGCSAPYIKQMARGYKDSKSGSPKGIGDLAARTLENVMNKERGWMDHDHSKAALFAAQPIADYAVSSPAEAHLLAAFRSATESQKAIALSWAEANRPRDDEDFQDATGTH